LIESITLDENNSARLFAEQIARARKRAEC
jgi:hypothetical protein